MPFSKSPNFKKKSTLLWFIFFKKPLIAIIIDNLGKLYSWAAEGEVRIVGNNQQNEHLNMILNVISDNLPNVKGPIIFKEATTR